MTAPATMTEGEVRELCHAFLDAYEQRRPDVLARLYAEDCVIWHNVFGRETTGADNLARFADSYRGQRRRTYDDRTVDAFADGFVVRYSLDGVQTSGHRGSLWICIVARCRDGRITRIDEYMDSGRFAEWAGRPRREAPHAT